MAMKHRRSYPRGIEDVVVTDQTALPDWAERLYAGEKPVRKEPTRPVDPDLSRAMRVTGRAVNGSMASW
jgi:hypothetical protein